MTTPATDTWIIRELGFDLRASPIEGNSEMIKPRVDDPTISLAPGRYGIMEPVDTRRGVDTIRTAALVIVPALAVDRRTGVRLGRGGGSYDRALARVGPNVPTVALLHDGELMEGVPAESHDCRVRYAMTPEGLTTLM